MIMERTVITSMCWRVHSLCNCVERQGPGPGTIRECIPRRVAEPQAHLFPDSLHALVMRCAWGKDVRGHSHYLWHRKGPSRPGRRQACTCPRGGLDPTAESPCLPPTHNTPHTCALLELSICTRTRESGTRCRDGGLICLRSWSGCQGLLAGEMGRNLARVPGVLRKQVEEARELT